MIKKKYLLLAGLCAAVASSPAFAQESQNNAGATSASYGSRDMTYRGESYDVLDSSYVPGSRMSQHRKFLNHQTNFPAKPRNMWEVGVNFGLYNVSGDVPSTLLWNGGGYGLGVHVRKALGYIMSLRLDYTFGIAKGMEFQPSNGYMYNPAWNGHDGIDRSTGIRPYNPAHDYTKGGTVNPNVFYNYKTESHLLNLDAVASLGNILFHKARTKIDPYVFAGLSASAYQTWVNSLDKNGNPYQFDATAFGSDYSKFVSDGWSTADRSQIRKDLKAYMDDTYETSAESDQKTRRPVLGKNKLSFAASFGAGVQFRLSKRINLSIEDRVIFFPTTNEDLLDGQRWDEGSNKYGQVPSQSKDGINYFSVGLNFNIGGGSKNVEPLYWLNPLDYSYGELSAPRHMILPEPVLADADGDGVTDQFDKCPGTPAGVAVDTHGCPMDTDGDGVPDDRDKELITPTECQPVDADGRGTNCPCHCKIGTVQPGCNVVGGSLSFGNAGSKITPAMQAQLATLAAQMQASPDCRVVIMGNAGASKLAQQRSWDRVNAVIEYMSEKNNIDRNRFVFRYDGQAPENTVVYRATLPGEEGGSSNVPPPHPDLRR